MNPGPQVKKLSLYHLCYLALNRLPINKKTDGRSNSKKFGNTMQGNGTVLCYVADCYCDVCYTRHEKKIDFSELE